jgi:hypothetical protein
LLLKKSLPQCGGDNAFQPILENDFTIIKKISRHSNYSEIRKTTKLSGQ